jgi:hypothetical protein
MKLKTKNLLENKFVLYLVFFVALVTVFSYIVTNNYAPVLLFLLISILTYYFSKNMIVILGAAIVGTHVVSLLNGTNIFNGGNREGFKEGPEETSFSITTKPEQTYTLSKKIKIILETNSTDINGIVYSISGDKHGLTIDEDNNLTGIITLPKKSPFTINIIATNSDLNESTGKEITFTESNIDAFTNQGLTPSALNIPSVDNLAAKDDTAKNKEKAYDLLESALGGADSKEMKAMAGNTKDLLGKQVQLMDQMKQITPILQQTMGLVNNLDLSSLTSMADKVSKMIPEDLGSLADLSNHIKSK